MVSSNELLQQEDIVPITITEALAEIKTIAARIIKKRDFIVSYVARAEGMKDPLEKDGGSPAVITRELQSIADLEKRVIALRRGIARVNEETLIEIAGEVMTIAEWLTWRRDVVPAQQAWLGQLRSQLRTLRDGASKKGASVFSASVNVEGAKPADVVVNIDEGQLATHIDRLTETLGTLDGQLSLRNATVTFEV